jgi:hypothetical protein
MEPFFLGQLLYYYSNLLYHLLYLYRYRYLVFYLAWYWRRRSFIILVLALSIVFIILAVSVDTANQVCSSPQGRAVLGSTVHSSHAGPGTQYTGGRTKENQPCY